MKLEADSYLKSGSNEVRILEYRLGDACFGINILKVNKIISKVPLKTKTPHSHPAIKGIFEDRGKIIPIIDLAAFLGLPELDSTKNNKIVITEFFEQSNGFLVSKVDWIHHFKWEDVIDAKSVMGNLDHRFILGMVKPSEDHIILLLDYETIILDLCPELQINQTRKIRELEKYGEGRRALIAEDSTSVQTMLSSELSEMGFEVTAVHDGIEALNTLKLDPDYDIIISDVEMPRMDGLALTCAIRDGSAKCPTDTPVIVYSSIGDVGMKNRAEFLKADAHVTKLNIEELLDKVREFITKKDASADSIPADEASADDKIVETNTEEIADPVT
ncbi:MAG: chemotaxis protein CheV [candidate division Zixibacteria bacterium]|nr:chemotaxis protein CheV [candidate division Zixibacteria bacterium]